MPQNGKCQLQPPTGYPCDLEIAVRHSLSFYHQTEQPFLVCFFSDSKSPLLKASLLDEAEQTGDIQLVCKDGSKVPAHSAVLASIPYFRTRLKDDWSGPGWTLTNKLELSLPCPVTRDAVEAFLKYAYGGAWSLRQLSPTDALMMQELFSLADACGLLSLCSNISDMAVVTLDSVGSWLEFVSKEHGSDVQMLDKKIRDTVGDTFEKLNSDKAFWEALNAEQLSSLAQIAKSARCEEATLGQG
ncbi:hypothetical protein KFL_005050040 [Klebsormidium nitens]|uniref:BTB domain-containing protein n=1 Tax=Klebsormidium nitens TaxID=105231 RepID=A0A1Y1IKS9_KLENI|nr:hypothetical protein KFL_005050040 [Klebsormidium nitens]|eukprot:GAQ89267.1 hypothetical protein KFL_005050040 [Klebsormidium nitens]